MPNIESISDLHSNTAPLDEVAQGSPMFFSKNGRFQPSNTNTARGESKTPILGNRGEIGGNAREREKRMPMELDSKIWV